MKRVIIDKQTNLNYKGKDFKFPQILLSILGVLKHKNDNKWDSLIVITGKVGSAKSTMAHGLAGVWEMLHKRELTIENFTWSAKGVVDFIDREGNEGQSIIFDEAIKGGTGRDIMSKEGNLLKVGLVVGRRKRHLYLMLVDELSEFNKKIISRARLLIDMRTLMVRGVETRGYFKIYNQKELQDIYWMLKEQKLKYISQYSATSKPFYKFRNFEGVFLDEEEYESKKIEETRQSMNESNISWRADKVKAFHLWSKDKHTNVYISEKVGVHKVTIGEWVKQFKKVIS